MPPPLSTRATALQSDCGRRGAGERGGGMRRAAAVACRGRRDAEDEGGARRMRVSHFEAALEGVQTNELGKLRLG